MKLSPHLAALLLLGASGAAYADQECKFYNDTTREIMSPGTAPTITFLPSVSSATLLASNIIMELTPQMQSHCMMGIDGEDVFSMTDSSLLIGSVDGKALFRTNIPGIEYTIGLYPDGRPLTAWFLTNTNSYTESAISNDNESYFSEKNGMRSWISTSYRALAVCLKASVFLAPSAVRSVILCWETPVAPRAATILVR